MLIHDLIKLTSIALGISVTGYILSVLIEKLRLKQGTIVLKNVSADRETIDRIDSVETELMDKKLRIGDEIKVKLMSGKALKGIVVGFSLSKGRTLFMNTRDKFKEIDFSDIKKIKIISRYGKFFSF